MRLSSIFCSYYSDRMGWFRLFGYGLKFKDTTRHPLLFSERYKHVKYLMIGKWMIGFLTKNGN